MKHLHLATGICPWTNIPATLHIFISLHFYCSLCTDPPTTAHIHQKINKLTFVYHTTANYVPIHKYALQMPNKCHTSKLLDEHQWGKCTNIHAIYGLTGKNHGPGVLLTGTNANDATDATTMMMMMQPDYISWVCHRPSQPKSVEFRDRNDTVWYTFLNTLT